MPKSTEEMLQTLEELIDEYSAFQRGRPDLPQGNLVDLSQDELEQIVDAFQQHKSQLDEQAGADLNGFIDCSSTSSERSMAGASVDHR